MVAGCSGMFAKNSISAQSQSMGNPKNLIGNWVAQINIPQSKMTILLEFDFLNKADCVIKCKWTKSDYSIFKYGRAKYELSDKQLTVTFLNKDEFIHRDNIFKFKNVYNIDFQEDKLLILGDSTYRNPDWCFGRGYENRGFATIIFPNVRQDIDDDQSQDTYNSKSIIGDWVAQINFQESEGIVIEEYDFINNTDCIIRRNISSLNSSTEEIEKAKYILYGNQLSLIFLEKGEVSRTEVYNIILKRNRLTILGHEHFDENDITYGRSYKNRCFATIEGR